MLRRFPHRILQSEARATLTKDYRKKKISLLDMNFCMVHSASDYEYIREYCYFYSLDDALPFRPSLDILNAFRHEVIHVNIGHFGSYSPLLLS